MGKLIVLLIVVGGLYYIGTNVQFSEIDLSVDKIKDSIENSAPISAVKNGRLKRQKDIMDATSF